MFVSKCLKHCSANWRELESGLSLVQVFLLVVAWIGSFAGWYTCAVVLSLDFGWLDNTYLQLAFVIVFVQGSILLMTMCVPSITRSQLELAILGTLLGALFAFVLGPTSSATQSERRARQAQLLDDPFVVMDVTSYAVGTAVGATLLTIAPSSLRRIRDFTYGKAT